MSLYGRVSVGFFVILLMLTLTFAGIIFFKKDQLNNLAAYANVNCLKYEESVKDNLKPGIPAD